LTIPTDEFISELSSFITEAATKFPESKSSYSTLTPRGDIPAAKITRINEPLIAGLSILPNAQKSKMMIFLLKKLIYYTARNILSNDILAYLPQI